MAKENSIVQIYVIGGTEGFGKNALVVVHSSTKDAIMIDAGIEILGDQSFGFDAAIPDFNALPDDIKLIGCFLTHGHDDHIGALPWLPLSEDSQIFGTEFTLKRAEQKFQKQKRPSPKFRKVSAGKSASCGPFQISYFSVAHSIPDACLLGITVEDFRMVHSGDFRVDLAPPYGKRTDLDGIRRFSEPGIDLLCADSTGALTPGQNAGEGAIREPLRAVFQETVNRLVVTTFSTHIWRVAMLADLCREYGRKLMLSGPGFKNHVALASETGLIDLSDILVDSEKAGRLPRNRVCILATGTQSENRSAIWRISRGEFRDCDLTEHDVIFFSSSAIPGNEKARAIAMDRLVGRGFQVIDGKESRHVSGHGHREDLRTLIRTTKPRSFLALHGGERHLAANRQLAEEEGVRDFFVPEVIPVVEVRVFRRRQFSDPHSIIQERKALARAGVLVVGRTPAGFEFTGWGLDPDILQSREKLISFCLDVDPEIDFQRQMRKIIAQRTNWQVPEIVCVGDSTG